MEEMNVNWLAIIAAALSTLPIGFFWYHKKVFGTAWMQATGMTEEKAQAGNMPVIFGVSVVVALLLAMFLRFIVLGHAFEDETGEFMSFGHGAFHGIMAGIFVAMPIIVTNGLFEQKNLKYLAINTGFWIACFAVMGGIINAWA